jgi:hypothetical protein
VCITKHILTSLLLHMMSFLVVCSFFPYCKRILNFRWNMRIKQKIVNYKMRDKHSSARTFSSLCIKEISSKHELNVLLDREVWHWVGYAIYKMMRMIWNFCVGRAVEKNMQLSYSTILSASYVIVYLLRR